MVNNSLIVDDSATMCGSLMRGSHHAGRDSVGSAPCGGSFEDLQLSASDPFELILTDIRMPSKIEANGAARATEHHQIPEATSPSVQ